MENYIYVINYLTKEKTKFERTSNAYNDYELAKIKAEQLTNTTGKEHRVFINHNKGIENWVYRKVGK